MLHNFQTVPFILPRRFESQKNFADSHLSISHQDQYIYQHVKNKSTLLQDVTGDNVKAY